MRRPKPPATVTGSPDDVEVEFYDALQRGDIERLMALWSDDDEIVCVHPSGSRLIGAAAIRASFDAIFANGGIAAEPRHVRRLESHAAAVHSVLERIRMPADAEGERFAWVAATNVYLKSTRGWRIVAHHANPGAEAEAGDAGEAAILH